MSEYTATYSPEDNKLRLYAVSRLPRELYDKVKAAGFSWAQKQELFVAPMWTPEREDLLLELAGEIDDEDKSLVDRAEERAERFEDYSDNRKADADQAHKAVASICDGIPLGQPILVGHHSERHARRDAKKIENGMRRAIKMWEQSEYWKDRAAGAVRTAKYKERPDVRARRIKGIEADKRKQERTKAQAEMCTKFWTGKLLGVARDGTKTPIEILESNRERICRLLGSSSELSFYASKGIDGQSNYSGWDVLLPDGERYENCPSMLVAEVQAVALPYYAGIIGRCDRWINHYGNRLAYERAMLAADGGTATDRKGPEKGGAVKCWASVRGCWSYIQKVNKVSVTVLDNWGNGGGNFTRTIPFDKCFSIMTAAEVQEAREAGRLVETSCKTGFGLCGESSAEKATETSEKRHMREHVEASRAAGWSCLCKDCVAAGAKANGDPFEAMRESLKAGVQVVTAPQLFPTPPELAAQMVELAKIEAGMCVLEPSAGTGNLIQPIVDSVDTEILAYEVSQPLCSQLTRRFPAHKVQVRCKNFLDVTDFQGQYPRIIMNPPFERGSDIEHIKHAMTFLAPGGRLVAICANGPRQREALEPLCSEWIDLPEGSFKDQGTNVNTAMLVIDL